MEKESKKTAARPLVSLCLPTNGVTEWVLPVLDSIYDQGVSPELFEVIVTDNGKNEAFREAVTEYAKGRENLIYRKTEAKLFHNQLEALKLGSGEFLKFVNHRTALLPGSLEAILSLIRENRETKPVIYLSNGALDGDYRGASFDGFVRHLGKYASWTTGVGIWKTDYDAMPANVRIDPISPHSVILFRIRKDREYLIDNRVLFRELDTGHGQKGTYDLFKAFGVEEVAVTQNLYIDGDITADTFKAVKEEYRRKVSELYLDFCIRKQPCSYDLSGFDDAMGIYFTRGEILRGARILQGKQAVRKLLDRIGGKGTGAKRNE